MYFYDGGRIFDQKYSTIETETSRKKLKPWKDFEEFIIMMTSKMDNFEDDEEIKEIFR